jgi:tetratricopeptide (TPR) repeat protein/O-antigen ligase
MIQKLITIFSRIIEWGIILLAFLFPIFILPFSSEIFEFPKQILLFSLISLLTFVWVIKMILERSVKFLHSPLTLPILILFVIFLASTIFSINSFSSVFGTYPKMQGGLVSLTICLLMFFLISSNIREKEQVTRILIALSLSGLILSISGILHFLNVYPFAKFLPPGRLLTLAGSADAASLFLVLILPITLFGFLFLNKKALWIFSGISSTIFIFYILLVGQLSAIAAVFIIFFLALIFSRSNLSRQALIKLGIIFFVSLLLLGLTNIIPIRTHIPFLKNRPIQHDISINQGTGWTIAIGGFRNLKLLTLGSGPGTFIFDFTAFKPIEFNKSPYWNLRFERSSNEYFQIISTLGLLGLFAFLYLLLTIGRIIKKIWRKEELLLRVCLSSVLIFFVISLFNPSSTLTMWAFWLFLGLTLSIYHLLDQSISKEIELSLVTVQPRGSSKAKTEILPWLLGIVTVLILVPLLWQGIKISIADFYFAKAQRQPNGDLVLKFIVKARNWVPVNDVYHRVLSNDSLNFAIVGEQQKLLSEDAKQSLLKTALQEGQLATSLAPHDIFNWENLQQVYTVVTIAQNDEFLINNILPQEIALDPTNPQHRNDLGWIYFNMRNDIEAAKVNFQTAVDLKPDFAVAHYNLARVYKEEGRKDLALQEYEGSLNLLNQQISNLEPVISGQPELQSALNQLKQSAEQVEKEKDELQVAIELEKSIPPPTENPSSVQP